MTSTKDIQTPFAKGASVDKKDASTEKTPVNNNQTPTISDTTSTSSTMAPTLKPLPLSNRKRSSAASSNDEGTGNESSNPIKRTRIEGEKKTPPSQSTSSRGLTRPEDHVFYVPEGAIVFGKTANKKDVEGFSSAVTPSQKLIDVKVPAQDVKNETVQLSSQATTSSRIPPSPPTPATEEDDEEEVLSPPSTSPTRFTTLNKIMRRACNTKADDTNSVVLCRDMAEIMKIKDYNFAVMSKKLAKLEKDAEANLLLANDSKSDLLEKAKAETRRVKAELQNQLEESHEVINEWKLTFDGLAVDYRRSITVQEDALKEAATAKKEVDQPRLDVTNSIAYKELLEKFNASEKRAAAAEEKALCGDPADKKKIRQLKRQINEFEAVHKDNVKVYEDLKSKYNRESQAHEDKCEELKKQIHDRQQRMEGEFQRGCNVMENHYRHEYQHLKSELRNYQLENQHLQSELGYYQVEHQRLQSELAQGRQWANSIVNSCPYPIDRVIEAENARDWAFAESNEAVRANLGGLQELEREQARILEEHNEYLRGRTLAAGSEGDGVPYIKTEPAEEGRHDGMYSATPPPQRQTARAQSPVSNTTEPFPLYDDNMAMDILADVQQQEQKQYQDDDNHHFSSHTGDDSDNDGAPAAPAAGLATAKLRTRKSRAQLREYQPVDSNPSHGIHQAFSSTRDPGDFRTIFKCPHNRGTSGNNCNHCGEQVFFEGDKEFDSEQPAATPQDEEYFDDLPDYESDEPVSPPPEEPKRGARRYIEVQPYAGIPNSVIEDNTTPPPPGERCSHEIMYGNTCGVCGETMKDASKVTRQAAPAVPAPVAKDKIAGTSARGSQSLAKKDACQHLHLDKYGVCEDCYKCQHLKVNDDDGTCQFCWQNVNPPVAAPGVAAPSASSSLPPPPSKKRRNRLEVDSELKSESKARSRPIKKVKTVAKNSLDSMFPTLPDFHPDQAAPPTSSAAPTFSAASFFKPAHPGWKTPAVLSNPLPPAPAASTFEQAPSVAATSPKCSQSNPSYTSPSPAPSNEEAGDGSK
ncbi:hypothetical protein OCU04_000548 [Sclerotinia nivalis]|uniref:Uncharacterized protein n=1 Tax=Sclerotinia nivalis TaxID=352851 RepID=A0A9X0DPW0_9HELO|nr:hypothetical protein OCU04_000548 [Sclerotinia nivalis]